MPYSMDHTGHMEGMDATGKMGRDAEDVEALIPRLCRSV